MTKRKLYGNFREDRRRKNWFVENRKKGIINTSPAFASIMIERVFWRAKNGQEETLTEILRVWWGYMVVVFAKEKGVLGSSKSQA
jgi:hypothetical protein